MSKTGGVVVGIRVNSPYNKEKHLLEIELDERSERILLWQRKKVTIKII